MSRINTKTPTMQPEIPDQRVRSMASATPEVGGTPSRGVPVSAPKIVRVNALPTRPQRLSVFLDLIPADSRASVSYRELQEIIRSAFSAFTNAVVSVSPSRWAVNAYEWGCWDKSRGLQAIQVRSDDWIDRALSMHGIDRNFPGIICFDGESAIPYPQYPECAQVWRDTLDALHRVRPRAQIGAWGIPRKYFWQWEYPQERAKIKPENNGCWQKIKDHVGIVAPEVYPPNALGYAPEKCFEYACRNLDEAARLARGGMLTKTKAILPWIGPMAWSGDGGLPVAPYPEPYIDSQIASTLMMGHTRVGVWAAVMTRDQAEAYIDSVFRIAQVASEIITGQEAAQRWAGEFSRFSAELTYRPQ